MLQCYGLVEGPNGKVLRRSRFHRAATSRGSCVDMARLSAAHRQTERGESHASRFAARQMFFSPMHARPWFDSMHTAHFSLIPYPRAPDILHECTMSPHTSAECILLIFAAHAQLVLSARALEVSPWPFPDTHTTRSFVRACHTLYHSLPFIRFTRQKSSRVCVCV